MQSIVKSAVSKRPQQKIIQIKRNIASSPAQGNAEFNKYLKITCANVITIINRYRVAMIGLNNKLIKSLFIFRGRKKFLQKLL